MEQASIKPADSQRKTHLQNHGNLSVLLNIYQEERSGGELMMNIHDGNAAAHDESFLKGEKRLIVPIRPATAGSPSGVNDLW